jgi:hypothetical protein
VGKSKPRPSRCGGDPLVVARIAGPFEFTGGLIHCLVRLRGSALKDDFRGMAFGTANQNLVEFFIHFWSRIVLRLVVPHCRPSPRQTYLPGAPPSRFFERWDSTALSHLGLRTLACAPGSNLHMLDIPNRKSYASSVIPG